MHLPKQADDLRTSLDDMGWKESRVQADQCDMSQVCQAPALLWGHPARQARAPHPRHPLPCRRLALHLLRLSLALQLRPPAPPWLAPGLACRLLQQACLVRERAHFVRPPPLGMAGALCSLCIL